MPLLNIKKGDIAQSYGLLKDYQTHLENIKTQRLNQQTMMQQQQLNELNIKKAEAEQKQVAEMEAWGNADFNVKLMPQFAGLSAVPEVQKQVFDWGKNQGYWDENGIGKRKFGIQAMQDIQSNPELMQKFVYPVIQAKEGAIMQKQQELADGQYVLAPEKKDKIAQEIQARMADYTQSLEVYKGEMAKLLGQKATSTGTTSDTQLYAELIASGDPEKIKKAGNMIEFRRAQAKEAGDVQLAKNLADLMTVYKEALLKAQGTVAGEGKITDVQKKEDAKTQVSGTLTSLNDLYTKLNKMGSAINVENPSLDNFVTAVASSNVGQKVATMFGDEAQSIRNQINQQRPLLLNYIRQASNMGARGLDSEKELEFYLQAATDPSRDVQANLAALEVLDKAYGLGQGITASKDKVNALKKEFKTGGETTTVQMPDGSIQVFDASGKRIK